MSPAYAYLLMREHPCGREMLLQLLSAGLPPAVIIEEDSPKAAAERLKFEQRLVGQRLPPALDELLVDHGAIERIRVPNHNGPECEARLRQTTPDLLVLGGTRILHPRIFDFIPHGALNAHPGLLPEVRGAASVAWAIYHDLPVGCTCHFIDAGIDAGDIVVRREIAVRRGVTYEQLVAESLQLSGALMVEALRSYAAGTLVRTPQVGPSQTFRVIPPELVVQVQQKLIDRTYRCYAV